MLKIELVLDEVEKRLATWCAEALDEGQVDSDLVEELEVNARSVLGQARDMIDRAHGDVEEPDEEALPLEEDDLLDALGDAVEEFGDVWLDLPAEDQEYMPRIDELADNLEMLLELLAEPSVDEEHLESYIAASVPGVLNAW